MALDPRLDTLPPIGVEEEENSIPSVLDTLPMIEVDLADALPEQDRINAETPFSTNREEEDVAKLQFDATIPHELRSETSNVADEGLNTLKRGEDVLKGRSASEFMSNNFRTAAEVVGAGDAFVAMNLNFIDFARTFITAGGSALTSYDSEEHFVDRFLSAQARISAANADGIFGFLQYEPASEYGQRDLEFIGSVWHAAVSGPLEKGQEKIEGAIEHISNEIRRVSPNVDPKTGRLSPEDEKILSDITINAQKTFGAVVRATPEAALILYPFARGVANRMQRRRAAKVQEQTLKDITNIEEVTSEFKSVEVETIKQLDGSLKEPMAPMDAVRINTLAKQGVIDSNVIIETIEGTPSRVLSGKTFLQSVEVLQEAGVKTQKVRIRTREKVKLSNPELAVLDQQALSALKGILKNDEGLSEIFASKNKKLRDKMVSALVDVSGNIKRELYKINPELGFEAITYQEAIAGATPKAQLLFRDMQKNAYGWKGFENPDIRVGKKYLIEIPEAGARAPFGHKGIRTQELSEVHLFNLYLHAKRVQEIAASKPRKINKKTGQFEQTSLIGPISPRDAPGWINATERAIGAKRMAQFEGRAATVFDSMKTMLGRMLEEGLIDEKQFNNMKDINYITRHFVSKLDPLVESTSRNKMISVGESGIQPIRPGKNSKRALATDVEATVFEYIGRTERRIAKNRANRALAEVAKAEPKNGLVKVMPPKMKKAPEGWREIKYMEDGKKKSLLVKEPLAAEWTYMAPDQALVAANIARIFSGSALVKPLATGFNPEFIVRNLPRDIMHAWLATGDTYSSFGPMYVGQIARDLKTVAKDAFLKKGRYVDYINEGGGMNFLTHQGSDVFTGMGIEKEAMRTVPVGKGRLGRGFHKIKQGASIFNEWSELVVRLAIRERVIKNQVKRGEAINSFAATQVARRYLDFSQGGHFIKHIDAWVPYANANAQALRTSARAWTKQGGGAKRAAAKNAQLFTFKAAINSRAWASNSQVMKMINEDEQYRHLIFPTDMWINDERGNRRYLYARIALDSSIMPFTMPFDMLLRKENTGIDPGAHWIQEVGSILPLMTTLPIPPILAAAYSQTANFSFWNNDEIWKGDPNVRPSERHTPTTSTFFKQLGELTAGETDIGGVKMDLFPELSPINTEATFRTLFPSNGYIYTAAFMQQQKERESDPRFQEEQKQGTDQSGPAVGMPDATAPNMAPEESPIPWLTARLLAETPMLRKVFALTHPLANESEKERMLFAENATLRKQMSDQVFEAVEDFRVFKSGDPRKIEKINALREHVRTQYRDRPELEGKAVSDFFTGIAVNIVYKQQKIQETWIAKSQWNHWAFLPEEDRAAVFYNTWLSKGTEDRRKMMRAARAIDSVAGSRIMTNGFVTEFQKLRIARGEDLPLVIGE